MGQFNQISSAPSVKKTEVCGKFSDIVSEISTNFTV